MVRIVSSKRTQVITHHASGKRKKGIRASTKLRLKARSLSRSGSFRGQRGARRVHKKGWKLGSGKGRKTYQSGKPTSSAGRYG